VKPWSGCLSRADPGCVLGSRGFGRIPAAFRLGSAAFGWAAMGRPMPEPLTDRLHVPGQSRVRGGNGYNALKSQWDLMLVSSRAVPSGTAGFRQTRQQRQSSRNHGRAQPATPVPWANATAQCRRRPLASSGRRTDRSSVPSILVPECRHYPGCTRRALQRLYHFCREDRSSSRRLRGQLAAAILSTEPGWWFAFGRVWLSSPCQAGWLARSG
jgi:hypothetical protein